MIVCVCRRVSDRDIEHSVRSGCTTFDDVQFELGVATCCGSCTDCAKEVIDAACAKHHGSHACCATSTLGSVALA